MNKTGFLYDVRYLLHDTGPYHPEMPERLEMIYQGVEAAGLLRHLIRVEPKRASIKRIEAVHSTAYIRRFEEVCLNGHPTLDHQDNQMCAETYDTALLAAGGVIETAAMVMEGRIDNAFCAVRPPGHHAEVDQAMGFCYFNNVAVTARYLQAEWGIERIGIIDIDVHHGNGTQHIFERDDSVFYYSIHQHPSFAYPGTGREFEEGQGGGFGFTKNSPVLPGQSDDDYRMQFEKDLLPAMERFKPEFLLVSTGFDAHKDDDMSDIRLTTEGYSWVIHSVLQLAQQHCGGRLISVLEGGYCLPRLPELAANHIKILLGV
ncbi:MAG: histone deacetylase [Desulfobacteraceae bacterium]|jgi:acetoin utilization deacetylase AcuC-like enzyme